MSRHTIVRCPRCRLHTPAHQRSALWWLPLAAAVLCFVAMIFVASLIGPFIMFAVPFIALVGFAFGPLNTLLTEKPTCVKCGRDLMVPATERDEARAKAALAPARAREPKTMLAA